MAAYNSLIHRLTNTPMDKEDYDNELNIIKHIAQSNGFNTTIIDRIHSKKKKKKIKYNNEVNNENTTPQNKYTAITYTNILPQTLQYEFKKLKINISFKTNNNTQNILKPKTNNNIKQSSGVYKITCNDCDKYYIGQTGRTFYERYKEHRPKPNTKSTYAQHLIDFNHSYTDFDTNLKPLHICQKGKILDATEEFEIYKANKLEQDKLLNDKLTFKTNPLYETAIKHKLDRARQT